MICVGIDVAKDKHDCFIPSSEGEVLTDVFTIPNNAEGFNTLLRAIQNCTRPHDKIKVGLEATGHYSYNILGYLLDKGLPTYVINPLHTNLYRKSLSLRKTKTDRVDARTIATMLMSDVDLKSYTDTAYHNEELKSLTRYRFDKVRERAKLKQSISRLVTILFPELEKLVPTLHMVSVYALLSEFPGAKQLAEAHLTHLKAVLEDASRGRYGRDMAMELRDAARNSVGSVMPAKSLELQHTIRLIRELDAKIEDIEAVIQTMSNLPLPRFQVLVSVWELWFWLKSATFLVSTPRTRSLPMPACRRLPTSLGSFHCPARTRTWKSEAQDIYATPSITQPSMFAFGIQPLLLTLQKNEQKASITMLLSHMLPRN